MNYNRNVYIQNKFFCRSRTDDVTRIKKYLTANGYSIVDDISIACYIILSTCGCVDTVALKSIEQVIELKEYQVELIVIGCLPDTDEDKLKEIFSGKIVRNIEMDKLDLIFDIKIPYSTFEEIDSDIIDDELSVEVCRGCTENCSYCAIRKAIGKVKSKPIEKCIKQIEEALIQKVERVVITAENVGAYGLDINTDISALLKSVKYPQDSHILRVNNLNPRFLLQHNDTIIQMVTEGVIGMLKIPIQSGSQRVLNLMRRNYDINEVEDILINVKDIDKDVILLTDIIVGFPDETEEELDLTAKFIIDSKLDAGRVFLYSPKVNTDAERMHNQVPQHIKYERLQKLFDKLKCHDYFVKQNEESVYSFSKRDIYYSNKNPYTEGIIKLFN